LLAHAFAFAGVSLNDRWSRSRACRASSAPGGRCPSAARIARRSASDF